MQSPWHGPDHRQSSRTEPVHKVLGADARQKRVRVPWEPPRAGYRWRRTAAISSSDSSAWGVSNSMNRMVAAKLNENKRGTAPRQKGLGARDAPNGPCAEGIGFVATRSDRNSGELFYGQDKGQILSCIDRTIPIEQNAI